MNVTREGLESADDVALADRMNAGRKAIIDELKKRIVGQADVVELVLATLFVGGHCLLVGVPGPGEDADDPRRSRKSLDLRFNRIQFTPDLMPSDITGTEVIQEDQSTGRRRCSVRARARSSRTSCSPTKSTARRRRRRPRCSKRCRNIRSRSAARTYTLAEPFFVLATQNPIEQEGTYPLPEAQLDRFMFNIIVELSDRKTKSSRSCGRRRRYRILCSTVR